MFIDKIKIRKITSTILIIAIVLLQTLPNFSDTLYIDEEKVNVEAIAEAIEEDSDKISTDSIVEEEANDEEDSEEDDEGDNDSSSQEEEEPEEDEIFIATESEIEEINGDENSIENYLEEENEEEECITATDSEANEDGLEILENLDASEELIATSDTSNVKVSITGIEDAFGYDESELSFVVNELDAENNIEVQNVERNIVDTLNVAKRITYDIKVLHDNSEIEPLDGKEVSIKFVLKDIPKGADKINIYHHLEDRVENVAEYDIRQNVNTSVNTNKESNSSKKLLGGTNVDNENSVKTIVNDESSDEIVIETKVKSFSYYTVDFTYEDKSYSMGGNETSLVSDILKALNIDEKIEDVIAYQDENFTIVADDNEIKNDDGDILVKIYNDGEWKIDSLKSFGTTHGIVVKTVNGEYKIKLTDPPATLCFTAVEANAQIQLLASWGLTPRIRYSTDGTSWSAEVSTFVVTINNPNEKLYVKGDNSSGLSSSSMQYIHFSTTGGKVSASGNIMGLLDDGACSETDIPNGYCFCKLFDGCTTLTTAPDLPATALNNACYQSMFNGCTALTAAPALPALDLGGCPNCYQDMFNGCSVLTTAPDLPATTLETSCYQGMFNGCKALTKAPTLAVTDLSGAPGCYEDMFNGCIALATPPNLPATRVSETSYKNMFNGCISLTTIPTLPATTLGHYCYENMFANCSKIKLYYTATATHSTVWKIDCSSAVTNPTLNMFQATGGDSIGTPALGTSYYLPSVPAWGTVPWTYDSATKTLTLTGGTGLVTGAGVPSGRTDCFGVGSLHRSITIDPVDSITGMGLLTFAEIQGIKKIVFAEGTDKVRFDSSDSLIKIFYDATLAGYEEPWRDLEEIDFSGADFSNIETLYYSFASVKSLKKIIFPSSTFAGRVNNMEGTFNQCASLSNIENLSNMDTSRVNTMKLLFYGCNSLTSIDLSNFNTILVEDMDYMFSDTLNMTTIDLSSFDFSACLSAESMFNMNTGLTSRNTSKLTKIILPTSAAFSNVTNMNSMFAYCEKLTTIENIGTLQTSNLLTECKKMFVGCEKISELNLTNLNTSSIAGTNMDDMFDGYSFGGITYATPSITKITLGSNFKVPSGATTGLIDKAWEGTDSTTYTNSTSMLSGHSSKTGLTVTYTDPKAPTPTPSSGNGGSGGSGGSSVVTCGDIFNKYNVGITSTTKTNDWLRNKYGNWYYIDNSRNPYRGWFNDPHDKQWYYLDKQTGIMAQGWTEIDGKKYYFSAQEESPNWFHSAETGFWYCRGAVEKSRGAMFSNEKTPDGVYVNMEGNIVDLKDEENEIKNNVALLPNMWYRTKNGLWYYLDKNITPIKGWYYDPSDNQLYYLDKDTGVMATGWKEIDGKYYYFSELEIRGVKSKGSMYRNETTPDGHIVDKNGVLVL